MPTPRVLLVNGSKALATREYDPESRLSYGALVSGLRDKPSSSVYEHNDEECLMKLWSVVAHGPGGEEYVLVAYVDDDRTRHASFQTLAPCMRPQTRDSPGTTGPVLVVCYGCEGTSGPLEVVDVPEAFETLSGKVWPLGADPTELCFSVISQAHAKQRASAVVWQPSGGQYDEFAVTRSKRQKHLFPFGAPIYKARSGVGCPEVTEELANVPFKVAGRAYRLLILVDKHGRGMFREGSPRPASWPVSAEHRLVYGPAVLYCIEQVPTTLCEKDVFVDVDAAEALAAFAGLHRSDALGDIVTQSMHALRSKLDSE